MQPRRRTTHRERAGAVARWPSRHRKVIRRQCPRPPLRRDTARHPGRRWCPPDLRGRHPASAVQASQSWLTMPRTATREPRTRVRHDALVPTCYRRGSRPLDRIDHGTLRLTSRWRNDLTQTFTEVGELQDELAGRRVLLAGEIVALRPDGSRTSTRSRAVTAPDCPGRRASRTSQDGSASEAAAAVAAGYDFVVAQAHKRAGIFAGVSFSRMSSESRSRR
jgi:hypothetical protein